jgi:flagellar biosynthesis chaperone FliJ
MPRPSDFDIVTLPDGSRILSVRQVVPMERIQERQNIITERSNVIRTQLENARRNLIDLEANKQELSDRLQRTSFFSFRGRRMIQQSLDLLEQPIAEATEKVDQLQELMSRAYDPTQ